MRSDQRAKWSRQTWESSQNSDFVSQHTNLVWYLIFIDYNHYSEKVPHNYEILSHYFENVEPLTQQLTTVETVKMGFHAIQSILNKKYFVFDPEK